MSYSSLIVPCLALRSTDTVETLAKTQQRYQLLAAKDEPEKANRIHTCVNLQKKDTGLSGMMCEIQGSSLLNAADLLTDEAFRGISVVRCNVDELQGIQLLKRRDELNAKLTLFLTGLQAEKNNKAGMLLDQIMPSPEGEDFWWLDQTCEVKGGLSTKDCILYDGKRGDVTFYDAFTCIRKTDSHSRAKQQQQQQQQQPGGQQTHGGDVDKSFKDACVWDPMLHGSVGLYTQHSADGSSLFLICVSDFHQIASEIVRSIKSDLGNSTTVYDFCSSKEMWFLENIAVRNRLRLILRTAEHLGINVPRKADLYAHPKQDNPDLAVQCCGVNLDHIESRLDVDHCTHKVVPMVRHYKDCTDVTQHRGPVPVFLGHDQGFLLLLPEKINHASFSMYTDTNPFVPNKTGQNVHLCPILNIAEKTRANMHLIQEEHQHTVNVTIDDLLYDMHQQGLQIPPHVHDLLTATDEYGGFIFYGVQYGAGTPNVIYPRLLPAFVQSSCEAAAAASVHHTLLPRSSSPSSPPPHGHNVGEREHDDAPPPLQGPLGPLQGPFGPLQASAHQHAGAGGLRSAAEDHRTQQQEQETVCEAMCDVFVYKAPDAHLQIAGGDRRLFNFHSQQGADSHAHAAMSLEWSDSTLKLVQKMTRMQHIDTLLLVPHAVFSNHV